MISYWISVKDTKKDFERTSVDELLEHIKNGKWKDQVELVRSAPDEETYKKQKIVLPKLKKIELPKLNKL